MTPIVQVIKSILGRFWLQFWEDSWLVQGLLYVYSNFIAYTFQTILHNLHVQVSAFYTQLQCVQVPRRLLLQKQKVLSNKSVQQLALGTSTIGQTNQYMFAYKIVDMFKQPAVLYCTPTLKGSKYTQFDIKDNVLYTSVDFDSQSVQSDIFTVDGQLVVCYQLWGVENSVSPIIDNFSAIAKIPSSWATTYPGAIQDAWAIRQFGATKARVKSLLGKVCQCPVASLSGVVTRIQKNFVYVNDVPHKCWSQQALLVSRGEYVSKGQPLCSYSVGLQQILYVYQGETPAYTQVPKIPVITPAGVLYAENKNKQRPLHGLPLVGKGAAPTIAQLQVMSKYTNICQQLSDSDTVPRVQLPSTVNAMQFLIQTVWKSNCVLIVVPVYRNQRDVQTALSCIVQNMPVGSIVILYQNEIIEEPVQLNLTEQNQVLAYYTAIQKENLYKEISQWE